MQASFFVISNLTMNFRQYSESWASFRLVSGGCWAKNVDAGLATRIGRGSRPARQRPHATAATKPRPSPPVAFPGLRAFPRLSMPFQAAVTGFDGPPWDSRVRCSGSPRGHRGQEAPRLATKCESLTQAYKLHYERTTGQSNSA